MALRNLTWAHPWRRLIHCPSSPPPSQPPFITVALLGGKLCENSLIQSVCQIQLSVFWILFVWPYCWDFLGAASLRYIEELPCSRCSGIVVMVSFLPPDPPVYCVGPPSPWYHGWKTLLRNKWEKLDCFSLRLKEEDKTRSGAFAGGCVLVFLRRHTHCGFSPWWKYTCREDQTNQTG